MYNKYPYTDFHELNLDWFLGQFKELVENWDAQKVDYNQFKLDVTTEFNTLSGKFDNLKETVETFTTFVENYFENLDVQQEINNKLDAMVLDGTMAALLAPLVTAQVPSAVSSWLTENVDPVGSAVIVDGTLSIAGAAADAKVVGEDLMRFRGDCPPEGWNINTLVENGFWTIRSTRVASCTNKPVMSHGNVLILTKILNGNAVSQIWIDETCCIYRRDVDSSDYSEITTWKTGTVQTKGSDTLYTLSQKAITDFLAEKIDKAWSTPSYVHGTPTVIPSTLTYKTGTSIVQTSNANYTTLMYTVPEPCSFKISGKTKGSSNALVITADADNTYLSSYCPGSSSVQTFTDEIVTVTDATVKYVYICLYQDTEGNTNIEVLESIYDNDQDIRISKALSLGNRFVGKKIVTFGDSRTWYDGHTYGDKTKSPWTDETCVGYQQTIQKLLGCETVNQGVSGETSAEICSRIRAYDFTGVDAVLLEGGVNDFVKSGEVTIGSIQPIGSVFDTTTVYGAWQSAVEYILNNYPSTLIYMDIPAIAWLGVNDDVFPYDTAKIKGEVAALYNLPCLNLYKTGGINILNRDYYYVDDTSLTNNWHLHFNDYGNELIGNKLAQFINNN